MHLCGAAPCPPIKAYAHAQTPTTICYGDTAKLKATHNYSTSWYRNGQLVAEETDRLFTTQGGTYLAVANNGLCYDTAAPIVITVRPPLVPQLTQSGDSLLALAYYSSYQWIDRFGAAVPGETHWWFRPPATDSFRVRVTDSNGCRGISALVLFEKPTGFDEAGTEGEGISLYPNPATGSFVVTSRTVPLMLQLRNLQGQVLWQTRQTAASARYNTAALGLHPDTYLLSFSAGGVAQHRRFVVR